MVFPGEMGPKAAKLVNLDQILTCKPLIRLIIHQCGILEGPKSLKSFHKIVLPENIPRSAFYMTILGEMCPKVARLAFLPPNTICNL